VIKAENDRKEKREVTRKKHDVSFQKLLNFISLLRKKNPLHFPRPSRENYN